MIKKLLKNHDMAYSIESHAVPLVMEKNYYMKAKVSAGSLQINWNSALGTLNGKVEIYIGNTIASMAKAKEINVNSNSNMNDPELILLDAGYEYLKIKYIASDISAGRMTAIIHYS